MTRIALFAAVLGVSAALPLQAQGRGQLQNGPKAQGRGQAAQGAVQLPARTQQSAESRTPAKGRGPVAVPPGQWPSAGMCRIWIDGVPVGQQPKETDCTTAYRRVPANGRVLHGESRNSRDGGYGWPDRDRRDDDRYEDRDDDRYEDRDDDRTTRRFIDRNGLECEEKAVTKNGKRSYDLKCREPKNSRKNAGAARGQDDGYCIDANRDGRCDVSTGRGYPATLPEMIDAVIYGKGQRTDDVAQWLGIGRYQVRYTDENRDRRPERVRWLDGSGLLLQEWIDTNRDGRANIVNIYSAGQLVQTLGGR